MTSEEIRAVLSAATRARGCTDWHRRALAAGDAFGATRDYALDRTPPSSPEREAALGAGDAVLALLEPDDEFVYVVGQIMEQHEKPASPTPTTQARRRFAGKSDAWIIGELETRLAESHRQAQRVAHALLTLWDVEGGECAHGIGYMNDCAAEGCAHQELRPALREAAAITGGNQ